MNSSRIVRYSIAKNPLLLKTDNRIMSFGCSYKHPSLINAMVESYMYYNGDGDVVECAFCPKLFCNWSSTDIPAIEHNRLSPKCLLSQLATSEDSRARCRNFECVVCLSNERKIMCVPCCHVIICKHCVLNLTTPACPLCRIHIKYIVPVFL